MEKVVKLPVESPSLARLADSPSSLYITSEATGSYDGLNTKHASFLLFLFLSASGLLCSLLSF